MATTAQSVIDKAAFLLNDVGNVRWTVPEMLGWLSDGQREAVIIFPELNPVSAAFTLAAGASQDASSVATLHQILRVARNLGSDGVTPGRAMTVVSSDMLDTYDPDWHSGAKSATIKHYCYDPRFPKLFQVYPPAVAGAKVQLRYAALPALVAATTDNITLADATVSALVDYLCYRALTKDAEFGDISAKAAAHRALFEGSINALKNQLLEQNPNNEQLPYSPASVATAK
jgi:hypothetical protein